MAKFALLFALVFVIGIQVSYCDVAEDAKEGLTKAGDSLTEAFGKAKEGFEKIFTQENVNQFTNTLKTLGEEWGGKLKTAFETPEKKAETPAAETS